MHVTITKCLDCWFSVDVATSMLVDKRKSVIFFEGIVSGSSFFF